MEERDGRILGSSLRNDQIIVRIKYSDKLNMQNAKRIELEMQKYLNLGFKNILFDLSKVRLIDSAGFQTLISVQIDAKLNGINFVIYKANDDLVELFKLVDLDSIFHFAPYRRAS